MQAGQNRSRRSSGPGPCAGSAPPTRASARAATLVVVLLLGAGCALDSSPLGRPDGRLPDAGQRDAGGLDASRPDAGTVPVDAGTVPVDAGPPVPADWFDPRWASRTRLTFDNTPHDEDLDDFPVLVVLDATRVDYAQAGTDGEQIRFTDPDGTALAYEIERWQADGTSWVWVRVPRIDANSGTDFIWLYYDAPGVDDGQDAAGVWTSDYRAVWHLDGDYDDSTANGNDGSSSPAADEPSLIGNGKRFAADQHSVVPDAPSLDITEAVTISAWMNPTSLSHQLAVLAKREACEGEANYALFVRYDDRPQFEHYDGGWRTFPRGTIETDRWQWVTATFDTATDEVSVYIDGERIGDVMTNDRALLTDANAIEIGRNGGCGGDYMEGLMDEVRLESVARSRTWVAAQYRSMSDDYITYGAAERIR